MDGRERLQPKPNGPLPAPESYERESCGPKPDRPGLVAIGTDMEPVPVTGLAANFSPMPRTAPPPLGSAKVGAASRKLSPVAVVCNSGDRDPSPAGRPREPWSSSFLVPASSRMVSVLTSRHNTE